MRIFFGVFMVAVLASAARAATYNVSEKSIAQLDADLVSGRTTSVDLVRAYLARIRTIDRGGATLNGVIAINPDALRDARAADLARKEGGAQGPLYGIPLLVKENIETWDAMPTTAGSLGLKNNITHRDAPTIKQSGAVVVPVKFAPPDPKAAGDAELLELETELKVDLDGYLATTPLSVATRSLGEVIAFNRASARETALFGQNIFESAEKTNGLADPAYVKARAFLVKVARTDGLDKIFRDNRLDALVSPTDEPAWRIDLAKGDNDASNTSFLPAVAGYPHPTVPMGYLHELPVGISFIGPAWSEARLLAFGAAFERASHARARLI
jgi:Asp-tRNA(Asn)/Glu-tRNA(Gln) amidotransferase A subunit family amidase